MADPAQIPPVAEPSVATPAVVETPVTATIETPVIVETPVVETPVNTDPTKIAEKAPVAPVAVEPVKAPETLLGAEKAPEKPVEAPVVPETVVPEGTQPNTEGGQSAEPAPPPTYDAFVLPEGTQLETDKLTEFNGLLAELEQSGKADHAAVQAFGQKAVDFYVNEVKTVLEKQNLAQLEAWQKTRNDWKESFLKDPEIGGNHFQTTVDNALTFIRTHGGTAEQQTEFRNLMETSGLGNHPAMIRLLATAGSNMKEGAPLAAQKPVSAPKSKVSTLYGQK